MIVYNHVIVLYNDIISLLYVNVNRNSKIQKLNFNWGGERELGEVQYIRTLDAFKKAVKVAKREIDEDVELLSKVMDYFLKIESILKDGKNGK